MLNTKFAHSKQNKGFCLLLNIKKQLKNIKLFDYMILEIKTKNNIRNKILKINLL